MSGTHGPWGGVEDDITPRLAEQRTVCCVKCPVQVWCRGGIWPENVRVCMVCCTVVAGDVRLVRCGDSTIQQFCRPGNACNCWFTHADPGHQGCDRIVEV